MVLAPATPSAVEHRVSNVDPSRVAYLRSIVERLYWVVLALARQRRASGEPTFTKTDVRELLSDNPELSAYPSCLDAAIAHAESVGAIVAQASRDDDELCWRAS